MTMYPLRTRTFLTRAVEKGYEGSLLVSVIAHSLIHRCERKSDGRLLGNIFILKDSVVDREMHHLDLPIKKGSDVCSSRECGHQTATSCQFLQEPPSQGSPYQRGNKGWGISIQHKTTMTGNPCSRAPLGQVCTEAPLLPLLGSASSPFLLQML